MCFLVLKKLLCNKQIAQKIASILEMVKTRDFFCKSFSVFLTDRNFFRLLLLCFIKICLSYFAGFQFCCRLDLS
ncbi:hypothetical protein PUN28_002985 [Cardiocondyla obscurior]|uniref:Uncharacterized protein n=1 Tax=Cardiocondyla obscurior TaxID=286306 RepID=A0AAW2GX15_9HYME